MEDTAATHGRVTDVTDAFALTEDQELFRREWRRLFEEKFTERAAEIDKTGEFPLGSLKVLAEAGLTGINVPEAYGGAEADSITRIPSWSRSWPGSAPPPPSSAVQQAGHPTAMFAGTEEQKQRFLPQIADGSAMASYCLTEPGVRGRTRPPCAPGPSATATTTCSTAPSASSPAAG